LYLARSPFKPSHDFQMYPVFLMVIYSYVSIPIPLPNPSSESSPKSFLRIQSQIQPLNPSCLSFLMPYLSHRLSLNLASPSIAQLSRLLRLSIYMPSPRASQSRSEAPSLIRYGFNAVVDAWILRHQTSHM
jgi:hypothetical protein